MTDLASRLAAGPMTGRPPRFETADVGYVVTDTAIGRLLLATRDPQTAVTVTFAPDVASEDRVLQRLARQVSPRVLRIPAMTDELRRELDEALAGRRRRFGVRADLTLATPFQRTVLQTLAERVGYGERTSYGRLAAWVGRPSASRAVGAALGSNPLCVLVPCHRVVAADGNLTGYAGGLDAKRLLLTVESAGTTLV